MKNGNYRESPFHTLLSLLINLNYSSPSTCLPPFPEITNVLIDWAAFLSWLVLLLPHMYRDIKIIGIILHYLKFCIIHICSLIFNLSLCFQNVSELVHVDLLHLF